MIPAEWSKPPRLMADRPPPERVFFFFRAPAAVFLYLRVPCLAALHKDQRFYRPALYKDDPAFAHGGLIGSRAKGSRLRRFHGVGRA